MDVYNLWSYLMEGTHNRVGVGGVQQAQAVTELVNQRYQQVNSLGMVIF